MINYKYIVVGSGIFGSVIAERIASVLNQPVLIVEKRNHIGGNSYSEIDQATGIECHRYGSHIFHTSNETVWKYITQFAQFTNYHHKVVANSNGKAYFMPINLKTLCDVFQRAISPQEAKSMLCPDTNSVEKASNLEEKAIALIGEDLYNIFIKGYTKKQWEKDPKSLPPGIINRLPVRSNFNIDYFNDPYQGVPHDGYFTLFNNLLGNPLIQVVLNTSFSSIRSQIQNDSIIIYTGMIDEYFDYCYGHLEWRSLRFEWETHNIQDYQGTTVVNYTDESIPYTRIHEFKHFHPERIEPYNLQKTVICKEFPQSWSPGDEAYYPVNTSQNQTLLKKYQTLALQYPNIIFGGRLGCYEYWDMDKAIFAALSCFNSQIAIQP